MTTKPRRTPAARQAAQLTTTLAALRVALLTGACPPAIPQGERDAAVQDVGRCVAQLENLKRWYGKGGRR